MTRFSLAGSSKYLKVIRPHRLGLYGGTFDPIHLGHLMVAHDALEQARLDGVIFIPCQQSPLKSKPPLASADERLAMLRLALKGHSSFSISKCEIDRPSHRPSYTIDTVRKIQKIHPGTRLFWLIGADQLSTLNRWHEPKSLSREVTFLLFQRGDSRWPALPDHILSLPRPRRVDISATEIRQRLRKRLPILHLVPPSINRYIQRHAIYPEGPAHHEPSSSFD